MKINLKSAHLIKTVTIQEPFLDLFVKKHNVTLVILDNPEDPSRPDHSSDRWWAYFSNVETLTPTDGVDCITGYGKTPKAAAKDLVRAIKANGYYLVRHRSQDIAGHPLFHVEHLTP